MSSGLDRREWGDEALSPRENSGSVEVIAGVTGGPEAGGPE